MKPFKPLAVIAAAALALTACGAGGAKEADSTTPTSESTTLTVFAAASLNAAFPRIEREVFEPANPGIEVTFSFEGSSSLADQIQNGAPADVFASADQRNMDKTLDSGDVETSQIFANNVLTLITPAGNPAGVTGLDDSLQGAKVIKCHSEVPCGNLTDQVLEEAGIEITPVSEEQKVTDVRGKIESGEGDAGFVYLTDAMAAGDKVEIIPIDVKGVNEYPIAVVKESPNGQLAQNFIDAVMSEDGQAVLLEYGFTTPE